MGFGKWCPDLANLDFIFALNFVAEIKLQFFCQSPFAGIFSLSQKCLVKLTSVVNFTNILRVAFLPISLRHKPLNLNCK
jgi:hypothetical protein